MHGAREPGTGTQVALLASPRDADDDLPSTMRIHGETWKVGRQYWDSEVRDIVTLVEIVGKSSWCDTREPEECPPILVFEAERVGERHHQMSVSPHSRSFDSDRFTERYTEPRPPGL